MTTFLTEEQRAENEKLAKRIADLVAKAERTDNEHEAAIFMAKAEELMLKHAIDRADLEARGKLQKQPITTKVVPFPHAKCYYTPMCFFGAYSIVKAIGLVDMTYTQWNYSIMLWGTPTDIANAETMIRSAWTQAIAARKFFVATDPELARLKALFGTNHSAYWNAIYQFLRGYMMGFASKITEAKNQVVKETGAALVLVGRHDEIELLKKKQGVGKGRSRNTGAVYTNAYAKGKAEGRSANIGNQVSK